MAVTVSVRARVTSNHLLAAQRGVERLTDDWAGQVADRQVVYHQEEAPIGRHVYFDPDGNEHPGWLRESVDSVPLPGPSPSHLVTVHAYYGLYVNNGTRHMAANPFWDRAQEKTENDAPLLLDRLTAAMLARVAVR